MFVLNWSLLSLSAMKSSWRRHASRTHTACDLHAVHMHSSRLVCYFPLHPSINPSVLSDDWSLINISLRNFRQELIELLILHQSSAWATSLQVAVPSLGLWVYCCFSGWCLNWLADLSGLMGFWVASTAHGRKTARHRNTACVNWINSFVTQFYILYAKVVFS